MKNEIIGFKIILFVCKTLALGINMRHILLIYDKNFNIIWMTIFKLLNLYL